MSQSQSNNAVTIYIMATWRQWTFSLGLITILVAISTFVSCRLVPYISFAFAFILGARVYNDGQKANQGLALPFISFLTLLIVGVILLGINLTDRITGIYELAGHPVNDELPSIVQLVVAPVLASVSGAFILKRLGHGRFYRTTSGRSDVSLIQRIVWQETRYQTRLLFWITSIISVADWMYCIYSFSSVSLNNPDRFFFVWLPIIVYFLSLVYLGFRCFSLWALYSQTETGTSESTGGSSIIRFLIVCGDSLYLSRRRLEIKHHERDYFDTPARIKVTAGNKVNGLNAYKLFADFTGIENPMAVKLLFSSVGLNLENTIEHFICNLEAESQTESSRIKDGVWMTMNEIRILDRDHLLASELSSELVHIHSVAMASRIYDIEGNRRYAIKGYRPRYSMGDIKDWDIDFNDPRWVKVSHLNADKPFFRIRRFLNRLTQGIMR